MSQHNLTSMGLGDNYIGDMVGAVENGPGLEEHRHLHHLRRLRVLLRPRHAAVGALGLRNPMVIVSPWAKPQGTDSTTAVQPYSMLAFVEHNFRLPG